MDVLLIEFQLDGITEAEYYRDADSSAPAFADIPGMLAKIWLADASSNTFGGIYTFRDRASLEAYLASELYQDLSQMPGLANITTRSFGVLEGPSTVTRGFVPTAA